MHQTVVDESRKATSVEDHSLQGSPMHSRDFLVTPDPLTRQTYTGNGEIAKRTSALASSHTAIIVPSSYGPFVTDMRSLSNFSDRYLKLIACGVSTPTP